jgi:hypothetical protein
MRVYSRKLSYRSDYVLIAYKYKSHFLNITYEAVVNNLTVILNKYTCNKINKFVIHINFCLEYFQANLLNLL